MSSHALGEDFPALDAVEPAFARGEDEVAVDTLVRLLEARAGDPVCALAARALRRNGGPSGVAPDAMAAALDRLVHLVREQDAHIRTLLAMVERSL